jgi:hypothetical protein
MTTQHATHRDVEPAVVMVTSVLLLLVLLLLLLLLLLLVTVDSKTPTMIPANEYTPAADTESSFHDTARMADVMGSAALIVSTKVGWDA